MKQSVLIALQHAFYPGSVILNKGQARQLGMVRDYHRTGVYYIIPKHDGTIYSGFRYGVKGQDYESGLVLNMGPTAERTHF